MRSRSTPALEVARKMQLATYLGDVHVAYVVWPISLRSPYRHSHPSTQWIQLSEFGLHLSDA
jgi:hypothetical protein